MRTIGKNPGVLQLTVPELQIVAGPVEFTDNLTISGQVTFTGDLVDGKVPQFDHLKLNSSTYSTAASNPSFAINKTIADYYYQPLRVSLTAIGTITPAADTIPFFTGTTTADKTSFTAFARNVVAQTSAPNLMDYLSGIVGTIWTRNNDGHTSGMDADTLDGYHLQGSAGYTGYFSVIPKIGSDGVMEIGRYVDFHNSSGGGDYDVRLETGGTNHSLYLNSSRLLTAGNFNEYAPTLAQYNDVVANANSRVLKAGDTMTGRLKIRNTSPYLSLVDSTNNAAVAISNESGKFRIFSDPLATGVYNAGGSYDYEFPNTFSSSLVLMNLEICGANQGTVTFKGDVCGFSDPKLKKNIRPITKALDIVKALNGVYFDWIDTDKPSVGVLAPDVEKVLPELVYTNEQGIKSVAYDKLVAVLIEAIKELAK